METKTFEIPSSASQSSKFFLGNSFNSMPHGFGFVENHPQNPLITSLRSYNQDVESAFSNLTISGNSSFNSEELSLHRSAAAASSESICLLNHPASIWAHQRHDFVDGGCDNCGSCILHGKKPFSRYTLPDLPHAQQRNFGSSEPSLYSTHQLYNRPVIKRGRIVSLAKDKIWSGILISKLENGLSAEEIDMVLAEVKEFSVDLMKNQFGSHFVEKFFRSWSENQKTNFIMSLTGNTFEFISLCLTSHGARSIQKLLENVITPQLISCVVSALTPGALLLATDPNGQHVISFCVENFSEECVKHLLHGIADNFYQIAINKSGCCVIQACVEHARGEARQRLINEIIANAIHLAEDCYGNYVVQNLIGMKISKATEDLMRQFQGCFVPLSCNKHGSHVVEKFLKESGEPWSSIIIMEMVKSPSASMLLLDPYGNFVIQSALLVSKGSVHGALLKLIAMNAQSMQSNLYGKKILKKMCSLRI